MKQIIIFTALLIVVYAVLTVIINAPSKKAKIDSTTFNASESAGTPAPAADLKSEDLKIGTGDPIKAGQLITVNYLGTLTDGKKFDSSFDRNEPYSFTLGAGEVIKGWDQGLVGMKVGGKRRLTIPPELGYGATGQGSIPANATLIFEVELVSVEDSESRSAPDINL